VTARSGHTPEGVEATVATVMVVGHELQLVARLAGGGQLTARQPRDVDPLLEAVAPGERVRLTWAPTAPMLLGPTGPGAPSSPGVPGDGRRHHRARLREGATPHVAAAP
jgi:hypothetical protein